MISIIVPIYNRKHVFTETINSITNQTYSYWECIIVDDGSTDGTWEFINELSNIDNRIKVFKRGANHKKGPSGCRNFGVQKAEGAYIQFFDSDDLMHEQHLEIKLKSIKDNELVISGLKEFIDLDDVNLNTKPNLANLKIPENVFQEFISGSFPMMMVAPMYRKDFLSQYLPLNENLSLLEDHELHARILHDSPKIAIVNYELIFYRVGDNSIMNRFYKKVSTGLQSYLESKSRVLDLDNSKPIKLSILKMILGLFRQSLAERDFISADKCLTFIKNHQLAFSRKLEFSLKRIQFFYYIFKFIKKGDTKFKFLFKL